MPSKHKPVLAVRYFYADPMTGKEVKGNPSTTVYSPYAQARRAVAALTKGHRRYLGGLFTKGLAVLLLALSAAGCATVHKITEKTRGIVNSVAATTEIVDAAADDVQSVWKGSDEKAPPAPPSK